MIRRQRMLLWVFISLAFTLILYFMLPQILAGVLKYQLQQAGLRDPVVSVDEIGMQGTAIGELSFYHSGSQQRIDFDFGKVRIDYSLSSLFSGQVDDINVSEADIIIQASKPETMTAATVTPAAEDETISLPAHIDLPFQRLNINNINFYKIQQQSKVYLFNLEGKAAVDNGQLGAQLNFSRSGKDRVALNLELAAANKLRLKAYDPVHDISLLTANIGKQSTDTQAGETAVTANINLHEMSKKLLAWGITLPVENMKGSLNIQGQGELPAWGKSTLSQWLQRLRMQAKVTSELEAETWRGVAQAIDARLALQLDVTDGIIKWDVDKKTQLSFVPVIKDLVANDPKLVEIARKQGKQRLTVRMPKGLRGEMSVNRTIEQAGLNTGQVIHLQYGNRSSVLGINARLISPQLSLSPTFQINSRLSFSTDINNVALIHAKKLHAQGEAAVRYHDGVLDLDIQPSTKLSMRQFTYDGIAFDSALFNLKSIANCQYKQQATIWRCGAFDMAVSSSAVTLKENSIKFKHGAVHIEALSLKGSIAKLHSRTELRDIDLTIGKQALHVDRININGALGPKSFDAQARLVAANGAFETSFDMKHRLSSKQGRINYNLVPIKISKSSSLTDLLFKRVSYPLQLHEGSIHATGRMTWKTGKGSDAFTIDQRSHITLEKLAGYYNKTFFKDLSTDIQINGWKRIRLAQPAILNVAELNPGVPVKMIKLVANMDYAPEAKQEFTVKSLSAKLLGGEISTDGGVVDLNREHNPMTLKVKHLDLARILELEQNQGITGSGYIDGSLPFDFNRKGVFIRNGNLKARAPGGKLHYQANDRVKNLAKSNANIAMLLQALTDFSYNELIADADYDADGKLKLKVRLKGSNPEFQQGRAVHLNVNVEENVLQLIRSLQLGDVISEKIGERVLKRQQKD